MIVTLGTKLFEPARVREFALIDDGALMAEIKRDLPRGARIEGAYRNADGSVGISYVIEPQPTRERSYFNRTASRRRA